MKKSRKLLYGSFRRYSDITSGVTIAINVEVSQEEPPCFFSEEERRKRQKKNKKLRCYIEADDGNIYVVPDNEHCIVLDNIRVYFETPIKPKGKKLWAYGVEEVDTNP